MLKTSLDHLDATLAIDERTLRTKMSWQLIAAAAGVAFAIFWLLRLLELRFAGWLYPILTTAFVIAVWNGFAWRARRALTHGLPSGPSETKGVHQ